MYYFATCWFLRILLDSTCQSDPIYICRNVIRVIFSRHWQNSMSPKSGFRVVHASINVRLLSWKFLGCVYVPWIFVETLCKPIWTNIHTHIYHLNYPHHLYVITSCHACFVYGDHINRKTINHKSFGVATNLRARVNSTCQFIFRHFANTFTCAKYINRAAAFHGFLKFTFD